MHYRTQAEHALIASLESRLGVSSFLLGDLPTIADVAIFPFVRQFAAVDADWFDASEWRQTNKWLCYWTQSDLFNSVMDKRINKV